MAHSSIATLLCLTLTGCQTTLAGYQSTSGGTTATTTSSSVTGIARTPGAQISISSGAAPAPGAPGGQAVLSRGGGAVLLLGVIVVDAVSQFASWLRGPAPQTAQASASIADTCSCYGYKPVMRDE